MSFYILQGALEEGLIYAFIALGLYISYKILDIADMTTDGSFVLGSAVSSVLVLAGHPILALPAGMLAGALAGLGTAFLQRKLGVPSILSGIISMTGLYSINLLIQGGTPELLYRNEETLFSLAERIVPKEYAVLATLLVLIIITVLMLSYFFSTQIGLSVRATGDNIQMVQASSINPNFTISVGLCIANGLTALGGVLLSQRDSRGNINSGNGVVVIGLASLVIGGIIFRSNKSLFGLIGAVIGSIIYRIIFSVAVRYTPDQGYLKIVSALIIAVVIAYPNVKNSIKEKASRKGGKENA